jgi:serine/threonine protein kinase/Tol biopolymer transport system component
LAIEVTIASGSRLGPYEIVSPIGAGGMGEVYRARDTRLERTVAVKVLPAHLSSSPDVRARFEREAKTISALSHPHICALYDVGNQEGTEYLVMELLEGETLAERVARGALPLDQTLRFGAQIASALEAAHRKGIIHRDLKPSNVMVTKSGIKLLDFGLAKALMPAPTMESLTSAPTAARDLSSPGTILGTVPYMAPEVLQGKEADSRADIFALGAVLHEMATGSKAFPGTSPVSIMSAILTSEPPSISSLQPMSPASLDRLVRTCLAKDPDDRWQTARDVELQLSAIADGVSAPQVAAASSRPPRTRWLPWLVTGAVFAIAAVAMFRKGPSPAQPQSTIRFSVPAPANGAFSYRVEASFLAVSPDGSQLAYVASDPQGGKRIFLRPLSAREARPIPGTEGANSLFFSPDGRSVAFFAEGKLKRIELSGGAAVSICDVPLVGPYWSGTWGRGGDILFAGVTRGRGIFRVSATGGMPAEVIRVDPSRGEARVGWPSFLPDGGRFLYLLHHLDGHGNLMLAEPGKKPRLVMAMQSAVQYVDPGYLVFAREGALLAQRFDLESGQVRGEPFSIAERVRYFLSTGAASFAASRTGTLAYQSQEDVSRPTWLDRTGRELGSVGPPGNYLSVSIAPDGRRALSDRTRPGIGTYGVWSLDLERGTETPVVSVPETDVYPIWLPGGRSFAYSADRGEAPQLFRKDLATGREEKLLPGAAGEEFQIAQDVSPDGRSLLFMEARERGRFDVWLLPLTGGGKPAAFLQAPFNKTDVRFSPDGRYLAMITAESGQPEVYVTAYPGPGERIRVSTGGAKGLRWSRDGRELLYVSGDRHMTSVPVKTFPSLELGAPTALFALGGADWKSFDVSPDGKRFLAIVPKIVADELPLEVVVNWTAALEK